MTGEYEVGYGKPPKETRWVAGQSGNAGGKTSEQRKAEIRAAEKAALIQADLVDALANVIKSCAGDSAKLDHVNSDVHRLLEAVQNRAHGTPKQTVDNQSSDGTMTPKGLDAFYAQSSEADDSK